MMGIFRRIVLLCFIACFPILASASKLKQDPKLVTGVLANGLTYSIYPNDFPKGEAVFRLFIKSGSVFEEENQRGLAHFLEHMAFNGTRTFPGSSLIKYLESKGGKFGQDLNAHTSFNETVYKLQLPTKDPFFVDTVLTILADWADGLLLDSTEIEQERGVIYSEWLSKAGPEKEAQEAFLVDLLNGSRYADRMVIGDTSVILHASPERIREFYRNWYHPTRMMVAIAGDVDVHRTQKIIRKLFGAIKRPNAPKTGWPTILPFATVKAQVFIQESLPKIEFNQMQLLPLLPSVNSTTSYDAYLQQVMLNRLMSARFSTLSFENPPYKSGGVSISGFLNTKNILFASTELIKNKVDSGIQAFTKDVEQIFKYGFIPLEINKQKKSYLAALKRTMLSKNPVASSSIMDEQYATFFRGDYKVTPEVEYKLALKAMDLIDSLSLVTYLHSIVDPKRTHYFLTGFGNKTDFPDEEGLISLVEKASDEDIKPFTRAFDVPESLLEEEPVQGSIVKREEIPDIQAVKLDLSNGATVIFKRSVTKRSQLILSGFRQGGQYSLDSADFVSSLFTDNTIGMSGAGQFTRESLSQYLSGNSASVRFLIDLTRSGIFGSCNLTDKESMFRLLYLKWMQPKADTAIYQLLRSKSIENFRTANRTPSMMFNRELGYILQGKNYVNRELSDTLIEKELHFGRLLPIFQRMYGSADGFTFILTADCEVEELIPFIERYIGALPSTKVDNKYIHQGSITPEEPQLIERHTDDNPRATVSLIFQKDSIGSEFQLSDLKGEILKNVLRRKFLSVLREQMGMVYSVGVSVGATRHPSELSRITISFSCLPENAKVLIDTTLALIHQLADHPELVENELTDVKTNLVKEMQMNIQKDTFWSGYIRNNLFNDDLDWTFINRYPDIVASMTINVLTTEINQRVLGATLIKAVLFPKEK